MKNVTMSAGKFKFDKKNLILPGGALQTAGFFMIKIFFQVPKAFSCRSGNGF